MEVTVAVDEAGRFLFPPPETAADATATARFLSLFAWN